MDGKARQSNPGFRGWCERLVRGKDSSDKEVETTSCNLGLEYDRLVQFDGCCMEEGQSGCRKLMPWLHF